MTYKTRGLVPGDLRVKREKLFYLPGYWLTLAFIKFEMTQHQFYLLANV